MTFEEIRKDIKARKYKPIYFLCGEEPFFIDRLTALLENTVLTEDEKAFNQTVLYGNDVSMSTITDTARRFPMMSERQVVIVREAQNIRDFDNLLPYIDHYQNSTILVLAYKNKKPDKRKEYLKNSGILPIVFISNRPNFMTTRFRNGSSVIVKKNHMESRLKQPVSWPKAWEPI